MTIHAYMSCWETPSIYFNELLHALHRHKPWPSWLVIIGTVMNYHACMEPDMNHGGKDSWHGWKNNHMVQGIMTWRSHGTFGMVIACLKWSWHELRNHWRIYGMEKSWHEESHGMIEGVMACSKEDTHNYNLFLPIREVFQSVPLLAEESALLRLHLYL